MAVLKGFEQQAFYCLLFFYMTQFSNQFNFFTMTTAQFNILLADDDTDDCIFFKEALDELPLSTQLTTVYDGEQLMHLLTQNTGKLPNVVFLDINMPRKKGCQCLYEIKRDDKLKQLPVVVFSTSFDKETVNAFEAMGGKDRREKLAPERPVFAAKPHKKGRDRFADPVAAERTPRRQG